jgi:hypothetical protein
VGLVRGKGCACRDETARADLYSRGRGVCDRDLQRGKLPMVLIEVQTGGYLGEDDIVRYEDGYGRG